MVTIDVAGAKVNTIDTTLAKEASVVIDEIVSDSEVSLAASSQP